MLNTYIDRVLSVDAGWDYHPPAARIPGSRLAADFRKCFGDCQVHAEVQFGNMARWYSDMFKFQVAYSQELVDVGVSIVPMFDLARSMGQNIVCYERAFKELQAARNSIGLPILLIGLAPSEGTRVVDISACGLDYAAITGDGGQPHRYRIVDAYLRGHRIGAVHRHSPTGPMAKAKRFVGAATDDHFVVMSGLNR
jgi:hypothetical protein